MSLDHNTLNSNQLEQNNIRNMKCSLMEEIILSIGKTQTVYCQLARSSFNNIIIENNNKND